MRFGQAHWRAKLTDREVEVLRELLAERRALIERQAGAGMPRSKIDRELSRAGLSYSLLAVKFEVSKSHVKLIDVERRRQYTGACAA